jgi:hypothetical protein
MPSSGLLEPHVADPQDLNGRSDKDHVFSAYMGIYSGGGRRESIRTFEHEQAEVEGSARVAMPRATPILRP